MSHIEIIPIKPHSDGDASHKPNPEWKLVNPPTIYLEKVGTLWMEKRGEARPGVRYYLDKLPAGYTLYERERKDHKAVDKHLYGHPRGKHFDSPNRFFPHFNYLMANGTNQGCPCTVCGSKGGAPLPIGRPASRKTHQPLKPIPQPIKPNRAVDEEYTPDTIRQFIDRLKIARELDEPIEERLSMDWRAEKPLMQNALNKLSKQKSWLPRVGELVLFIRDDTGEICLDDDTKEYRLVRGEKATSPPWEAGVVGQVPEESVKLDDIVVETTKSQGVAYSGYRVEPLPDPNGTDKSLSRQYKYVPLHHVRPFVFWQEFLRGVPKQKWHPTVNNALKVMGSMSLVDRFRFKGTWPSATVFCRGIYIGSELICIGDTVRIIPAKDTVRDVLQVESIRLFLSNLDKAGDNDEDEGHPYNITVHLCGKAYTLDEHRAYSPAPVSRAHLGMEGYDDWFPLHDLHKTYRLAFSSVLGRCFEANPMLLWFPTVLAENSENEKDSAASTLTRGLSGVKEARLHSAKHDKRILPGKAWFWGDSRAETLSIKTLNNVEVSYHDRERDADKLEEWQKAAKVLDKTASTAEQVELVQKLHHHRLAATNAAGADTGTAGVGGGAGALRAAAVVTLGTDTPGEDDDGSQNSEATSEPVSGQRSKSTSNAPPAIAVVVHAGREKSATKKRSFSTMASSSRDELDHSPHDDYKHDRKQRTRSPSSADVNETSYSLEYWVKPVAMAHATTIFPFKPLPSTSQSLSSSHSPAPAPKAKSSSQLTGSTRRPGTAKRTRPTPNIAHTSSASTSPPVSTSERHRLTPLPTRAALLARPTVAAAPPPPSYTFDASSSTSEDAAATATTLLGAFQKGTTPGQKKGTTSGAGKAGTAKKVPKLVITIDD